MSTDEVYGSVAAGSWTEDTPLAPNSPYAAAKAGGDLMAQAYASTHGLNVSITRCCNNYGPYQYPEKVIPLFVTNLLEGRPVPLYGDGLTSAAGFTWTITAGVSSSCSSPANLAGSTMSMATWS